MTGLQPHIFRRRIGRCLAALTVMFALATTGCNAWSFGHSKQESLRKQVEADSFPTAAQAGV